MLHNVKSRVDSAIDEYPVSSYFLTRKKAASKVTEKKRLFFEPSMETYNKMV